MTSSLAALPDSYMLSRVSARTSTRMLNRPGNGSGAKKKKRESAGEFVVVYSNISLQKYNGYVVRYVFEKLCGKICLRHIFNSDAAFFTYRWCTVSGSENLVK